MASSSPPAELQQVVVFECHAAFQRVLAVVPYVLEDVLLFALALGPLGPLLRAVFGADLLHVGGVAALRAVAGRAARLVGLPALTGRRAQAGLVAFARRAFAGVAFAGAALGQRALAQDALAYFVLAQAALVQAALAQDALAQDALGRAGLVRLLAFTRAALTRLAALTRAALTRLAAFTRAALA